MSYDNIRQSEGQWWPPVNDQFPIRRVKVKARTMVAVAHVCIASGLRTKEQVIEDVIEERAKVRLQISNRRFLRRGIGRQEFNELGHHLVLAELENKLQTLNIALERL